MCCGGGVRETDFRAVSGAGELHQSSWLGSCRGQFGRLGHCAYQKVRDELGLLLCFTAFSGYEVQQLEDGKAVRYGGETVSRAVEGS